MSASKIQVVDVGEMHQPFSVIGILNRQDEVASYYGKVTRKREALEKEVAEYNEQLLVELQAILSKQGRNRPLEIMRKWSYRYTCQLLKKHQLPTLLRLEPAAAGLYLVERDGQLLMSPQTYHWEKVKGS